MSSRRHYVLVFSILLLGITLLGTVHLGEALPVVADSPDMSYRPPSGNPHMGVFTPAPGYRRRMPSNMAQGIPLPPNCNYNYDEFGYTPVGIPIPDGGIITSTITVTGARPYMWDVYLDVFISHTYSGDLDMTLTSPEGTVVTLSTDNGGEYNDIFAFTTFWDFLSFLGPIPYKINVIIASEYLYLENGVVDALVPEEALQAISGENPNGTWTLTVADDTVNGETGTLNNWGFSSYIFPGMVTETYSFTYAGPPVPIPDNNDIVLHTFLLTDVNPNLSIVDLDLHLDLTHPNGEDLDLQIRSGANRHNTLGTDNGGPFDNIYAGIVFDDDADPLGTLPYTDSAGVLSDHVYTANGAVSPMVPEESMGSFMGESAYGYWEMRMIDDSINGFSGTLNSFTMDMVLGDCPTGTPTPTVTTTGVPATATPTTPPTTATATATGSPVPVTPSPTATGVPPTVTPTATPDGDMMNLYLPLIQSADSP
jgi:subtilisin-like proprotein convertase family protein